MVQIVKGYKAVFDDMTSLYRKEQYEVGKWYHTDDDIKLYNKGFHFCKELFHTTVFIPFEMARFFEIEAKNKIIDGEIKSVASDIKFVREISRKEFKKNLISNIDKLIKDNESVRFGLADNPYTPEYGLEKLSHDTDKYVRGAVARRAKSLSVLQELLHDDNPNIRCFLARRNIPEILWELVSDTDEEVKMELVHNKHIPIEILHQLSYDDNPNIKIAVIERIYDKEILQRLSYDSNPFVRCTVAEKIADPIILDKLADDTYVGTKRAVAKNKNTKTSTLQKLMISKDANVRWELAKNINSTIMMLRQLLDDKDPEVRKAASYNPKINQIIKFMKTK